MHGDMRLVAVGESEGGILDLFHFALGEQAKTVD